MNVRPLPLALLSIAILMSGCDPAPEAICHRDGAAVDVASSAHNNVFPSLAWTGEAVLTAWVEVPPDLGPDRVLLLPLDADGVPLVDTPTVLADEVIADRAAVVWTGEAAVALWVERGTQECFTTRALSAEGVPVGDASSVHCVADSQGFPSVVAHDGGVAVAWVAEENEDQPEVHLLRLDGEGALVSGPEVLDLGEVEGEVRLGSAPDGLRIAWSAGDGVRLADVDTVGDAVLAVEREEGESLSIAGVTDRALAWQTRTLDTVGLSAAPLDGLEPGRSEEVSDPRGFASLPSPLVAGEVGSALAWTEAGEPDQTALHAAVLDADARRVLDDVELGPPDGTYQVEPSVVAVPGGWWVAWRSMDPWVADAIRVRAIVCE